jgi:hypothetical protein
MKSKKKVIQTGLNIAVKPISDQGMTEEEYRAKVAEIKKQHEVQETLNKVAEQHLAQRTPRGPVQRQQQRRQAPRRVVPRAPAVKGLLHPEEPSQPTGFLGLLGALQGRKQ